jgi:ring-1,2-phenylacetyl-CoA epoxidase subunit PaaE
MPLPPQSLIRDYRVTSRRPLATDAFELTLSPSDVSNQIPHPLAGQWVMLHLLESDGSVWGKAAYSIANAASDVIEHGEITLAIRVAGDFTQRANRLADGDLVKLQGPFGLFTMAPSATHRFFFAGGIGITPIRSMLLESLAKDGKTPMTLFYSMRTVAEAAYLDEFRSLADSSSLFTFLPFFTRETADQTIDGPCERICEAAIRREIKSPHDADCYVCGPRPFMDEVIRILKEIGVDPKHIHTERFG